MKDKMGGSSSKVVADMTVEAVTKVSSSVIANSQSSSQQNQGISIIHRDGDINIHGVNQSTTATINTQNLLKALSTTVAQQDLTQQLSQSAKALTSGVPIGDFSKSEAYMTSVLKSSIDVASNIQNTCGSKIAQQQSITIKGGSGKVNLSDINQGSVANIFQSCITNSLRDEKLNQQITSILDQKASAKTEGLSAFGIAMIIGMVVLAITAPIVVGGNTVVNGILKLFFPMMIAAGLVMIFLYFNWKGSTSLVTKYSKGMSQSTDCSPSGGVTVTAYKTFKEAHAAFMANDDYVAMDWMGFGETHGAKRGPRLPVAKTTFYTSMSNDKCDVPVDKELQLFAMPDFRTGKGVPSNAVGGDGDYYLDIATGTPYVKKNQQWGPQDTKVPNDGKPVTFNQSIPVGLKNGEYYMDIANPKSMTLYVGNGKTPKVVKAGIQGPGYKVDAPAETNMSAIKVKGDKPWLLWVGGASIGMGFVGFVLTTIFKPKDKAKKQ